LVLAGKSISNRRKLEDVWPPARQLATCSEHQMYVNNTGQHNSHCCQHD